MDDWERRARRKSGEETGPRELPDAAELLKQARRLTGASQRDVADGARVDHTTVSAYERGLRDPTVEMLRRLLHGAGAVLMVELRPRSEMLDERISRALAQPAEERVGDLDWVLSVIATFCEGVPYAIGGTAAAALHGAPVDAADVEVLVSEDDETVATLGERLSGGGMMVWLPERNRFVMTGWAFESGGCAKVLRELNPTRWREPVGATFQLTLWSAERLTGVSAMPLRDRQLRVLDLWTLELSDPAVAELLQRTREVIARGR